MDSVGPVFERRRRNDVVTVFAVKPPITEQDFLSVDVLAENADFPDPDVRFQRFVRDLNGNSHDRRCAVDEFLSGKVRGYVFRIDKSRQGVRTYVRNSASGGRARQVQSLS